MNHAARSPEPWSPATSLGTPPARRRGDAGSSSQGIRHINARPTTTAPRHGGSTSPRNVGRRSARAASSGSPLARVRKGSQARRPAPLPDARGSAKRRAFAPPTHNTHKKPKRADTGCGHDAHGRKAPPPRGRARSAPRCGRPPARPTAQPQRRQGKRARAHVRTRARHRLGREPAAVAVEGGEQPARPAGVLHRRRHQVPRRHPVAPHPPQHLRKGRRARRHAITYGPTRAKRRRPDMPRNDRGVSNGFWSSVSPTRPHALGESRTQANGGGGRPARAGG